MEHPEIYKEFCKDRFDRLEEKQNEIIALLKGDSDSEGLCERVRALERAKRGVWGAVIFVISVTIVQVIEYISKKFG